LGLLAGDLTPSLQEGLVRLSTHIPSFAKAAREFAFWTRITLHRSTASRISEAAGATAVALETAEAERILHTHPLPPQAPERLVVSVDGAMVPLLAGRWAEVRTLTVGQPSVELNAQGQQEVHTRNLSYFSRLTDSTSFAELATVEIHRRGVEVAQQLGAVVDGAEWCQTFLDLHAAQAVRILDFPHAAGYLEAIGESRTAAGCVLEADERAALRHDLKHTGPSTVLERLRDAAERQGWPGDTHKHLAYLEKREQQMDYPSFQAQGWPLGSGSVESANKLVVEERLKGPGMHWAEANVNPMLALRNAMCSDRWEEVWSEIEQEQRREAHARRLRRQRVRKVSAAGEARAGASREGNRCAERGAEQEDESAIALAPSDGSVPEKGRPAADHPWRKAWSIRRQRQIASTA
jgi:hypothetical protein